MIPKNVSKSDQSNVDSDTTPPRNDRYSFIDRPEKLTPWERALENINGYKLKAADTAKGSVSSSTAVSKALNRPATPPPSIYMQRRDTPHGPASQVPKTEALDSSRTPAQWRLLLPSTIAPTRRIPFQEALERCDDVMLGQSDVKKCLAMSIGGGILTHKRFFFMLEGPPGVGKTTLATTLGRVYGRPVLVIRCDSIARKEDLIGYGPNWKSPGPGAVAQAIIDAGVRNPILFFDEIDKVFGEHRNEVYSVLNKLLSREEESYRDEFLQCSVDTSLISFLCASNDEDVFLTLPWLESRVGQKLPLRGYSPDELAIIFDDHLLKNLNARTYSEQALDEERHPLAFTREARDLLICRYCVIFGERPGVRQLGDWLDYLQTGWLFLGSPGKAVDAPWLEANWTALFPGYPMAESGSEV